MMSRTIWRSSAWVKTGAGRADIVQPVDGALVEVGRTGCSCRVRWSKVIECICLFCRAILIGGVFLVLVEAGAVRRLHRKT